MNRRAAMFAIMALTLCILLAKPSASASQERREDLVTVTFRLTLYGNVPEGERFPLSLGSPVYGGTSFCGDPYAPPLCKGEEQAYTTRYDALYAGTHLEYIYGREGVGALAREVFLQSDEVFSKDATVSGYYVYDEEGRPVGGGRGDGPRSGNNRHLDREIPDKVPDVGAGGTSDSNSAPTPDGAPLLTCLLAAGAYTLWRRRRSTAK